MEKDAHETFKALQKSADSRTDAENHLLLNYILQIQFFSKFLEQGLHNFPQQCIKLMNPISTTRGEAIFHLDSEGNKFYTLISGKIGLYVHDEEDRENPGRRQRLVLKQVLSGFTCFGEVELYNHQTRSSTAQCLTDCQLAVIDKQEFDSAIKKLRQEILQEKIEQFQSVNSLFKYCSKYTVSSLYFESQQRTCLPLEYIIQVGQPLESIFIIKSGQFKIFKEFRVKRKKQEEKQEFVLEISGKLQYDFKVEEKDKANYVGGFDEQPFECPPFQQQQQLSEQQSTRRESMIKKQNHIKSKKASIDDKQSQKEEELQQDNNSEESDNIQIGIAELGKGEIFAYEDFIQKKSHTYTYSVRSQNGGELIIIRSSSFRKYLLNDKITYSYLANLAKEQTNYILQSQQHIASIIQVHPQYFLYNKHLTYQTDADNEQQPPSSTTVNSTLKQQQPLILKESQNTQFKRQTTSNLTSPTRPQTATNITATAAAGATSTTGTTKNAPQKKVKKRTVTNKQSIPLKWESGGFKSLNENEEFAEFYKVLKLQKINIDFKDYLQSKKGGDKTKLGVYQDELSQEFQFVLRQNYQDRFGEDKVENVKSHVPQEIIQKISRKLKIKLPNKVGKHPPKVSKSVKDYINYIPNSVVFNTITNHNTSITLPTSPSVNIHQMSIHQRYKSDILFSPRVTSRTLTERERIDSNSEITSPQRQNDITIVKNDKQQISGQPVRPQTATTAVEMKSNQSFASFTSFLTPRSVREVNAYQARQRPMSSFNQSTQNQQLNENSNNYKSTHLAHNNAQSNITTLKEPQEQDNQPTTTITQIASSSTINNTNSNQPNLHHHGHSKSAHDFQYIMNTNSDQEDVVNNDLLLQLQLSSQQQREQQQLQLHNTGVKGKKFSVKQSEMEYKFQTFQKGYDKKGRNHSLFIYSQSQQLTEQQSQYLQSLFTQESPGLKQRPSSAAFQSASKKQASNSNLKISINIPPSSQQISQYNALPQSSRQKFAIFSTKSSDSPFKIVERVSSAKQRDTQIKQLGSQFKII